MQVFIHYLNEIGWAYVAMATWASQTDQFSGYGRAERDF